MSNSIGPIDIINLALSKLGDVTIRSLQDNTTASRIASTTYDIIRRAELRKNYWNFSLRRTAITYLVDPITNLPIKPAWNYGLTYTLPPDCLRVNQVNSTFNGVNLAEYRNSDQREYVIETHPQYGLVLLTNMTGNSYVNGLVQPAVLTTTAPVPLPILYVADVSDTNLMDPLFVQALACKCAMEWSERLTQSLPKRQQAGAEYRQAIMEARSVGSCETPAQPIPDNTWILSRVC